MAGIFSPRPVKPCPEALESRDLMSIVFPPGFVHLPRTGGVSVLVGSVLEIGVGQSHGNAVQVIDEGAGHFQAEWNGGPVHSFAGVQQVEMFTQRAHNNLVTINLPDPPAGVGPARAEPGNRTGTLDLKAATRLRTSGTAVLTGSVLIVTVNQPTANKVQILDEGSGAVEVEWNGGPTHTFSGVATILVHAEKATKNEVIFDTPPLA